MVPETLTTASAKQCRLGDGEQRSLVPENAEWKQVFPAGLAPNYRPLKHSNLAKTLGYFENGRKS
jgi:hypothetical protein